MDVAVSSVCHLYWTSDLSLYNLTMVHVITCFTAHLFYFLNKFTAYAGLRTRFNFFFAYAVPVYAKCTQNIWSRLISLSGGLGLQSNIPRHTRMHAYTHKKNSPFQLK